MATLFSLALLSLGVLASAQSLQPSNGSLPNSEQTQMELSGSQFSTEVFPIAPLNGKAGAGGGMVTVATVRPQGVLTLADYSTAADLNTSAIAFISCDPNGSNIDPLEVAAKAAGASAVVLYSFEYQACILNGSLDQGTYFTMISLNDSQAVLDSANGYKVDGQPGSLSVQIGLTNSTGTSENSPQPSDSSLGSPAPTTAVAMSILYSITGIITLLFLVIIGTGAIRAHRNPERYGPRTGVPGRPRQSRAKGLARAMLETLPIVKFGDPEPVRPVKPVSEDVELEDGQLGAHATPATARSAAADASAQATKETSSPHTKDSAAPDGAGLAAVNTGSAKDEEETSPKEGDLGCSICTDDFNTGEDVRVLPCNHKYHPACIDPWLLNVSGTCPLCRHDLRPATSETSSPQGYANANVDGEPPPPVPVNDGADNPGEQASSHGSAHQRHRVSRLLDLRRLRHAPPEERIEALRQLRVETQRAGEQNEAGEEPSRRAQRTGRLRDRFRVRTRAQDEPTS
ncbi:ring finger domain protein [Diplocarpon rosae]|nr:ring finger domain protein [Diplocarpon rosae]